MAVTAPRSRSSRSVGVPSALRSGAVLGALALALTGCSSGTATPDATGTPDAAGPVAIATTTQLGSILGDITQCAGTTSATLMGPGDDPHEFAISSAQVAQLVRADLVVANGLGLEQNLESALANAASDGATVYEVAADVDPLTYAQIEEEQAAAHAGHADAAGEAGHDDGHDHGAYDPHVHMDVARMATAAEKIGQRLAEVTGDDRYPGCASEVAASLRTTDEQVRTILAAIPEDRHVLITDHEAYNYFAQAYGFEVAGVVIPGGSTDAEPSSSDLAALVDVIRSDGVSVIFSNNTVNPRLVDALAAEAGTDVRVVQLYEGSVGEPGTDAATYAGMMLTNARLIADALA